MKYIVVPKLTAFLHQGQGDASAQIVLFIRILEIELKEFQFIDFANKGNSLFQKYILCKSKFQ